jgi:hypothetical protein
MDAQDAQELTIVGADGTPHIFPAGVDPEKAAAVVREHDDFEKRGPMVRSRTGQMYRPAATEDSGGKEFVQGAVDAVKAAANPMTYVRAAKGFAEHPVDTAIDAVKMPFRIAGGLVTDPAYTLGGVTAGALTSHVVPASLPKAARLAGNAAEQIADKGSWPIRMVGSHQLGSGNPLGLVTMAVPEALKTVGGKLKAFGGADEAASVESALQRSGARNIETGPIKDLGIRIAPPTDAATTRVPMAHGEPAPITPEMRAQMEFDAARAPGGLLNRLVAKEDRPAIRPTGKAATDLAEGRTVNAAPPVGPASTLQDLARKNGTGIDQEADLAAQQLAAENERRLTNRNTRVPVSEGIPASKSKSAMSATPGLTRNDLSEVGLNPDLNYKNLTPDMLEKIRSNRAARHATNYGNAQADKAVRGMQNAVPMTHTGAFEQALLDRLR